MQKNNSKMWIGLVIVIIVIGIIFFVFKNKKVTTSTIQDNNTQTATTPNQNTAPTTSAGVASISYADALIKYANRRIQLDAICQAHPNNVTYKDNTGIMIDNRSAQTRTVKVGTTFTIKPYSFKIVVLPDIYLKSKTLFVNCDKDRNVATILIQE